jgi:hypothetical protein
MRGFSLLIEEVLTFQVTPDARRILVRNGKIFMALPSQNLSLNFIDITDCVNIKYSALALLQIS